MTQEAIKELEILNKLNQPVIPSGSYFICGEKNTDIDFFTLHNPDTVKYIEAAGYTTNMSEKYLEEQGFISYRRGKFNVILVNSEDHLYAIELATYLCTQLCVTDKEKRILVFNVLKAREIPEEKDKLDIRIINGEAHYRDGDSISYGTNTPRGLFVRNNDANRARAALGGATPARGVDFNPRAIDPFDTLWANTEPATLRAYQLFGINNINGTVATTDGINTV